MSLSVRTRLAVLVGGLLLSFLAVAMLAVWLPQQVQGLLKTVYDDRVVPLSQIKTVSDAYAVTVVDTLQKYRDGTVGADAAAALLNAAVARADERWRAYLQTRLTEREQQLVNAVQPQLDQAAMATAALVGKFKQDDRAALDAYAQQRLYQTVEPLTQSLQTLSTLQQTVAREAYDDSVRVIEHGQRVVVLLCAVVMGLGAWAALRLARSVIHPLREAVRLAEAVASGALQTPIEARGPQEVGQMLQAVERMRVALVERADRDALTGLIVRRRFDELAQAECERSRRQHTPFAVLLLDIDHFKRVNDLHGHAQGDRVLQASAAALQGAVRSIDHVARYGGEEFAVLLPGANLAAASRVAERVREAIAAATTGLVEGLAPVTASLGVAWRLPGDDSSLVRLMASADAALYEAKRGGRNQVVLAGARQPAARLLDQTVEEPD
jgi:diguanylate cyclase (GGDEF)-like protein